MDYAAKPRYHYRPARGWMNDPNGLVCFGGFYHVFYQHTPQSETPAGQCMHWGHARTRDFLTWEELPVALAPDQPYDSAGCWSGTAIVRDGRLFLVYASIKRAPVWRDNVQSVSVAFSSDGVHFEKAAENPVIAHYPADGCQDFRDPAVARVGDRYLCVLASGSPAGDAARLLLYESDDLIAWRYRGILHEWPGARIAECPSFIPLGDDGQCLLATSVIRQDDSRFFSIQYGRFREGVFMPEVTGCVDKGPDQYAGQVFRDDRRRNILISWIPGWAYEKSFKKNVGCLSVPKELTVRDGRVRAYPVEEVRHLLRTEDPAFRRTPDGFVVERAGRDPVVYAGGAKKIEMIRDGYILEVFLDDGAEVYTALL